MLKNKFGLFIQLAIVILVAGYFVFVEISPSTAVAQTGGDQPPVPRPTPPRIRPPPPPIRRNPFWSDTGVVFKPQFDLNAKGTLAVDAGHIDWDCAHADLETATADGQGGFVATGTYTLEHGGPTHPGEDDSVPALFVGFVKGSQLTLNLVTYKKGNTQTSLYLDHSINNRYPVKCR